MHTRRVRCPTINTGTAGAVTFSILLEGGSELAPALTQASSVKIRGEPVVNFTNPASDAEDILNFVNPLPESVMAKYAASCQPPESAP
jgi:hypothetical protein